MNELQDFGTYLRQERELRQIPLTEVASVTKIPVRALDSLERGDWEGLPAEIFVRGFVRSYGRHLGIEAEVGERYHHTLRRVKQREDGKVEHVGDAATGESSRRRFGVALFVLIVLIIATITFSVLWGMGSHASEQAALSNDVAAPGGFAACAVGSGVGCESRSSGKIGPSV